MKRSESMSAFLQEFPERSCCVEVPITNILQCVESIEQALRKSHGCNASEVTKAFFKHFRAICPTCCAWITPETLSGVSLASRMGRANVMFTNYGPQAHLLDGHCVLDNCPSKSIFLIWRGDDDLRGQVTAHLARLKDSATRSSQSSMLALLQELSSDKVLSFTIDTFWALQRNVADRHLYLKRSFENLVMWVSVIPYSAPIAKGVFEKGYADFLEALLRESDYDKGEISVAHWVCMGDAFLLIPGWKSSEPVAWMINLTLASKKNLPKQDKFFIVACELCDETDQQPKSAVKESRKANPKIGWKFWK